MAPCVYRYCISIGGNVIATVVSLEKQLKITSVKTILLGGWTGDGEGWARLDFFVRNANVLRNISCSQLFPARENTHLF